MHCTVIIKGFLISIHIILFIFNGLVVVSDGKSLNIEKELSLRFTNYLSPPQSSTGLLGGD